MDNLPKSGSDPLVNRPAKASVLPILLSPATLRPVAFRTFTKKHNLTITSSTLQLLASFVGKNCGSSWREAGLADLVLDEVAKAWKKAGGGILVDDGQGTSLKQILQSLESNMSGGRIFWNTDSKLSQERTPQFSTAIDAGVPDSIRFSNDDDDDDGSRVAIADRELLGSEGYEPEEVSSRIAIRRFIKVIDAFDQPRLSYNFTKKRFELCLNSPSLFPAASQRVSVFRQRYHLIHQRLLRNESFQSKAYPTQLPGLSSTSVNTKGFYKLSSIANLLGRGGTSHLLLGLLSLSPTGELSLTDPSGTVRVDLSRAKAVPKDGAWFAPGMIILIDGVYEEENELRGSALGGNDGVGGIIGGKFIGLSIAGPPCERRDATLGIGGQKDDRSLDLEGGFGLVDFLGVGSERAQGARMRQIETECLRINHGEDKGTVQNSVVIMSDIFLDMPQTTTALRNVFGHYSSNSDTKLPTLFILIGNFVEHAAVAGGGGGGSIEYKECFDLLASVLSEYPRLLVESSFVFVPGDNDPWPSSYSAGSVTAVPREPIPDLFTSRVKRTFKNAHNSKVSDVREPTNTAIWVSNPARISIFGPVQELVVFRDDISGRLRRTSLVLSDEIEPQPSQPGDDNVLEHDVDPENVQDSSIRRPQPRNALEAGIRASRKLVKTILDQGNLSPFPLNARPVLWDYAASLDLYPLPTAMILADSEADPFVVTYEGCHVMNPGKLVPQGSKGLARWMEYDISKRQGTVRERRF
ncbi:hypothetical protein AJ80_07232 [Polytolypa hystricis UAMH7299]|uniref:DNA polymerase epsilon subunit B n=1 Tax=Polytolypa hystricis (strain UAMH7299) TaxID=1447883 RepID=A0A2B7XRW1_POLH7|nr:hypothetical protein AJ80_07232 [Polytolypa hystricis UAMH7299]